MLVVEGIKDEKAKHEEIILEVGCMWGVGWGRKKLGFYAMAYWID